MRMTIWAAVAGMTAMAAVPALAAPPQGETLFRQRCQMCHTDAPGARNGVGPNLSGLSGRTAGTAANYKYSPKLAKSGITWNSKTLDQFLTAPNRMVPGTRMVISIPNKDERKAVVGFLLKGKK
ncbi:c-type cytochrome [Novosphingobium beihaiensis]|uniref:C-type cytochrome n=1 Tax=Novosphingobium beihaiensis TaxID=2930389 RepID=A0ABT0BLJ7_9SPHN|nr:c-type cytochrome [Novosphingobium beihaiensis]MCJ2185828.1 c-type cytochrome [Novosphingobium beihaiensis]